MARFVWHFTTAALVLSALLANRPATAQGTIKLGHVDPLSGMFAQQGDASLKHCAYLLDRAIAESPPLGKKFEIVSFRFDANTGMRAETLVRGLPRTLKSVYVPNQDYLFGQTLHKEAKEFPAKPRPGIEVVGEELIPLGKVRDFSPYVSKIEAIGAQAPITGNWGPDLNLLTKDVKYDSERTGSG